jgi:phage/plasmid-associated DNA primase
MDSKHPDQAQPFALEKFKMMTGGDAQVTRQNHENNQVTFKGGSVLIQTNIMPEMAGVHRIENASLRQRIEILRFPFSFVSDADLIEQQPEKYKPVDITLKARFEKPSYRKAFIDMLLDYHKIYRSEGIIAPDSIKIYKEEYFRDANKVRTWITGIVCEHKDVGHCDRYDMSLQALHTTFRDTGNFVTKKQFIEELTTIYGKRQGKGTNRGVFSDGGYYYLQGYQRKTENPNNEIC